MLDFLSDRAAHTVVLNAEYHIRDSTHWANLRTLLQDGYSKQIAFEFLFGEPEWALAANHDTALGIIRQALEWIDTTSFGMLIY